MGCALLQGSGGKFGGVQLGTRPAPRGSREEAPPSSVPRTLGSPLLALPPPASAPLLLTASHPLRAGSLLLALGVAMDRGKGHEVKYLGSTALERPDDHDLTFTLFVCII